jgi:hypothetical protein
VRSTYLIQRLKKPVKRDNPFAFGGGKRNGGLSDEAMGLLRGIFSFDYMGSAEFEFGAVPEALNRIANTKDLAATVVTVPVARVKADWRDKSKTKPEGDAAVYILCSEADAVEISGRVLDLATGSFDGHLKEQPRLSSSLRPFDEWDGDVCGWLELDNGYFFFTDVEMWQTTAELFGVETNVGASLGGRNETV